MGSAVDAAVVFFAFGAQVLFIAGYSRLAPWWRHEVGRAMVALCGALALALLPSVLHYAAGVNLTYRWFAWYYRASLAAVGVVTLWRLWVVWRVQRAGRPRRR
jgi:hypothetical protein